MRRVLSALLVAMAAAGCATAPPAEENMGGPTMTVTAPSAINFHFPFEDADIATLSARMANG